MTMPTIWRNEHCVNIDEYWIWRLLLSHNRKAERMVRRSSDQAMALFVGKCRFDGPVALRIRGRLEDVRPAT